MFKQKFKVIELERQKPLDEGARDSVPSLQHHPGFQYLVGKLKLQKAGLETALKRNHHDDIRAVDFLQSGILWLNYLEDFIGKEVFNASKPVPRDARDDEADLFAKAAANLQLL